jgi:histidinol dehydrogenase
VLLATPRPTDELLAAASLAGVSQVFDMGGAQAIAALAYGTDAVPRVDKIVGPGNLYVACAKKLVFGRVAIDGIAGPRRSSWWPTTAPTPRSWRPTCSRRPSTTRRPTPCS